MQQRRLRRRRRSIELTCLTIPTSPWRASTGFRNTLINPSEFIDATSLSPILPLLPTPITTILPPRCCESTIASTALTKPSRHIGSVAYSCERHDSATASVERTWVAVERIFSASRSSSESVGGGVIGNAGAWSRNGSWCSNWPGDGRVMHMGGVDDVGSEK